MVDYVASSHSKNISLATILNNLDKPWDFAALSRNPAVTLEFVVQTIMSIPWNFDSLSANRGIPVSAALQRLDLPWNFDHLSKRATFNDVMDHLDQPWNFDLMSANHSVSDAPLAVSDPSFP